MRAGEAVQGRQEGPGLPGELLPLGQRRRRGPVPGAVQGEHGVAEGGAEFEQREPGAGPAVEVARAHAGAVQGHHDGPGHRLRGQGEQPGQRDAGRVEGDGPDPGRAGRRWNGHAGSSWGDGGGGRRRGSVAGAGAAAPGDGEPPGGPAAQQRGQGHRLGAAYGAARGLAQVVRYASSYGFAQVLAQGVARGDPVAA